MEKLSGGLSGSCIYKVAAANKKYVLRIQPAHMSERSKIEYESMVEAYGKSIGSLVCYYSPDYLVFLMEFVEGKSLTLEKAKLPSNLKQLAQVIRTVHEMSLPLNTGFDVFSNAERCCEAALKQGLAPKNEIDQSISLLRDFKQKLLKYSYKKVRVHGDLNPRNIFLTLKGPKLIDWAESNAEDPFYDLNYFSLFMDYSAEQELSLIKFYLQRKPTAKTLERYQIQKRVVLAFWSLTNLYLASAELKKCPEQTLNKEASLKEWLYYRKIYADCQTELNAQFFYEFSRLCFKRAHQGC